MKNISQVILLSTSCLIWYGADNVCASVNVFSGIPKSGTHNTLHTTPYLAYPHLPHLRGERSVRGEMSRTERSAMLTSCLQEAQTSSSPEVGEAGGRKNSPVENFSTTGESLLTGEQVTTMQRQCYKPSDRSEVSEGRAYEARRRGVTSEASIPFSSNIEKMSLTGLIPPRELLTRLKSGEFLLPLPQGEDNKLNVFKTASVCFITDTGACSGEKFSNDETPGNGSGNPGGIPDYDTPQEQCQAAGYGVTSCPAGSHGDNPCPADSAYYQKCVCDANMTQTCTKPYYGVGPQCDGKYASCKRDDAKACKEEGYGQTAQCSSVQTPNKKCSYNSGYYDKCVCRSDLVTCTYPQSGVGEACGGKYASCQCPGSYKSCECGGAAGATSCTVNGVTTYSSCKECCKTSCPSGYNNSTVPNGYVQDGEACNHCSLGLRYKIKPNPCTGFQKCQFGPESGAKTCLSGATTLYDKCRPCNNACPSGYSLANPGGCYDTSTTECGNTCYKSKPCCTPLSSETGCTAYNLESDGCGGRRKVCCTPGNLSSCPKHGICTMCGGENSLWGTVTSTPYRLSSCGDGFSKSGDSCYCPAGKTITAYDDCVACLGIMGEYCPGDGNSYYCSDGTYVNSSLTGCNTCPKNHYCSWGEATPCPDGKTSPAGSSSYSDCK